MTKESSSLQKKILLILSSSNFKVENILKGSLYSIPSPSVKIQIMGGKVLLEGIRQKIDG